MRYRVKQSRLYKTSQAHSPVLQEMTTVPGVGESVSVRTAKAHLSALLDLVASGRPVTITSDGKPKARLVPAQSAPRKLLTGIREHLASMPPWSGGPTADEIIRAERDSREG